jgi:uncharacterized protein YprB with RNaseH-like and TPR domain
MIESTFVLLNGVGEYTERRLWANGIPNWEAFLTLPSIPGIGKQRKQLHDQDLLAATASLARGDARYFARRLKTRDSWRLFQRFRLGAVYLDIETTGGASAYGDITVVGMYANGQMTSLVKGDTLTARRLELELGRYDLIVTFFGSVFDLPYLRAKFPGLPLDHAHLDLCYAARRLGLRGGLKHLEQSVGIHRSDDLQGLTGWDAVTLWHDAQRGDQRSRERLLRYNEADCRNLEFLADTLCRQLTARCRGEAHAQ